MSALLALAVVLVLVGVVFIGAGLMGMHLLFGVVIPYSALTVFLLGVVWRVVIWVRAPVPFRIPTTCGQQKSLPFLRRDPLESPATGLEAIGRMALEVLAFRSLFRNTRVSLNSSQAVVHVPAKLLWVGALAFHWSMLIIVMRHLRFFLNGSPAFLHWIEAFDGFFQLAVPTFFISSAVFVLALAFLLVRRLAMPRLRYISLLSDYFALFLLLGVGVSGLVMRYLYRVDIAAVKGFALGLVSFHPVHELLPGTELASMAGLPFLIHIFLVSALVAYFPFSKLMHMAGVFMSPTRNLANNNREKRHVNPWNPTAEQVHVHTYEQWEADFRDKLKAVGYRLESEDE